MNTGEAVALIAAAVGVPAGDGPRTWADLGAGSGVFTRALASLLGPRSMVYAMDRDVEALAAMASPTRTAARDTARIVPVVADFTRPFELPGLEREPAASLDGLLLANALHFVRDQAAVLARLTTLVRPGGRVVLVEYDRRAASRWVPYPIAVERLPALAEAAGLTAPVVTATRPSAYSGVLYAARADLPGGAR